MTSYRTIRRETRQSLDERRSYKLNRKAAAGPDRFLRIAWRQEDGGMPGDEEFWPPKVLPFQTYRLVSIYVVTKNTETPPTYSFRVDFGGYQAPNPGVPDIYTEGTDIITDTTDFPFYFTQNIIIEDNKKFTIYMIASSDVEEFEATMELQEL